MTTVYKPGQVAAALFAKKKSSNVDNTSLANLFAGTKTPKLNPNELKRAGSDAKESLKRTASTDNTEEKSTPKTKKQKKKKGTNGISEKSTSLVTQGQTAQNVAKKSASLVTPPSDFPFQHESLAWKVDRKPTPMVAKPPGLVAKPPDLPSEYQSLFDKLDKSVTDEPKKKTLSRRKMEDEQAEARPRRNRQRDRSADPRTVFVGNCPLTADKKVLRRLFKEYGEIESVRFRCAPAAQPDLPRRATVITKNFNEKCKSYISYIVFKEESSAQRAIEKNGFVLDDLHLRVDVAASARKHDKKKSLFIGNLPFDVQEDEIRTQFSDCGHITNVRIVRDRQTSLGKGICFVQFESKDCVGLALKLNGCEFQGRRLRVMATTNRAKKKEEKKKKEAGKAGKKKDIPRGKGKKKMSFAPSNAKVSSFKTVLQNKKEKRLRKLKKKTKAKKTDQITAILGEAPAISTKTKSNKKTNSKTSSKKGHLKVKGKKGSMKGNKSVKSFKKRK